MSPMSSYYMAYGLHIRSEIAVPFEAATPVADPNLTIRSGVVPGRLTAPGISHGIWEAGPGVFLQNVEGVARYMVAGGREIVVEPAGGSDKAIVSFMLGSVLAACLQQRGMLTLHASAIRTAAGAVLFAGRSGIGKSTLLAAFADRGYDMFADDIAAVVHDAAGRPVALPAFPAVRLWEDALEHEHMGWAQRARREVCGDVKKKYILQVEGFRAAPLAVRAIFTLTAHNRDCVEIERIPPAACFSRLIKRVYRERFARAHGRHREIFRAVATLATQVPVFRVRRPVHLFVLGALADRIEACLREEVPAEGGRGGPGVRAEFTTTSD